jgi:hypothetical protein
MRKIGLPLAGLVIGFFSGTLALAADAVPSVAVSTAAAHRSGLNELKGTFQSKNDDPTTLRILVEGGYNVEFAYDAKTTMINGGSPITVNDLSYGDMLVIHYSGRDLYAIDIDRVSKAAQPL